MTDIRLGRRNRIRLMSPASRLDEWCRRGAWLAPAAGAAIAGLLWHAYRDVPRGQYVPGAQVAAAPSSWPVRAPSRVSDWSVFHSSTGPSGHSDDSLLRRFRLAGTFFAYGGGEGDSRKAVMDDLKANTQRIVGENEAIQDVTVVRIFRDRVVLRVGGEEKDLWLVFGGGKAGQPGGGTNGPAAGVAAKGGDWLGRQQVGENRWVMSRKGLLDYYSELRDQPQRLVTVFDSLKPVYDNRRQISGYQLNVLGEPEFFAATGLKEGDVIRSVNSMRMTDRRRAEYLLREFVGDRASVFVLDIERNGQPSKLIYEVR